FLFLLAQIPHHNRSEEHQDLRDLSHSKPGSGTYVLSNLPLAAAENVAENAARICRGRRRSLLAAAEYHPGKAADIIEYVAVVMLIERVVQALSPLRRRGIICKTVDQCRQCHRDRRIYKRAVRTD